MEDSASQGSNGAKCPQKVASQRTDTCILGDIFFAKGKKIVGKERGVWGRCSSSDYAKKCYEAGRVPGLLPPTQGTACKTQEHGSH